MIPILYADSAILVCIKPQGVLSTDEPGGLPELLRRTLGNPNADVRTVHRLDRVVGGLRGAGPHPSGRVGAVPAGAGAGI